MRRVILASVAVALIVPFTAYGLTVTRVFKWTGDLGYSLEAVFSYNDSVQTVIGYEGWGTPTLGLHKLWYEARSPNGDFLESDYNVRDGLTTYTFLKFSFDTAEMDFTPGEFIDVGSDPLYWLQGGRDREWKLWTRYTSGPESSNEYVIDSGGSYFIRVPDVGTTLSLFSLALAGLFALRRRLR